MAMISELTSDPKAALRAKPSAVVVFYAPWCGDCRVSESFEGALSEQFEGKVEFFRLDASEYEEIADSYGIERYPTYVFFRKGRPQRGALVEPYSEGEARNWLEIALRRR